MQIASINNKLLTELSSTTQGESSLEQRYMDAFASASETYFMDKRSVIDGINDPANTANPDFLLANQEKSSEYNINLSFISALSRKGINAVDTLLRA